MEPLPRARGQAFGDVADSRSPVTVTGLRITSIVVTLGVLVLLVGTWVRARRNKE